MTFFIFILYQRANCSSQWAMDKQHAEWKGSWHDDYLRLINPYIANAFFRASEHRTRPGRGRLPKAAHRARRAQQASQIEAWGQGIQRIFEQYLTTVRNKKVQGEAEPRLDEKRATILRLMIAQPLISGTDLAKSRNAHHPDKIIRNRPRNRNTLKVADTGERLHDPDFNSPEFEGIKIGITAERAANQTQFLPVTAKSVLPQQQNTNSLTRRGYKQADSSGTSISSFRQAANCNAARMSSASKYGYIFSTSSEVCPDANNPSTVPTVTRMPRIQGFPPITAGSKVMRSISIPTNMLQLKHARESNLQWGRAPKGAEVSEAIVETIPTNQLQWSHLLQAEIVA